MTSLLVAMVIGVFATIKEDQKISRESRDNLRSSLESYSMSVNSIAVEQKVAAEKMRQVQESLVEIKDATKEASVDNSVITNKIQLIDGRLREVERIIDRSMVEAKGE